LGLSELLAEVEYVGIVDFLEAHGEEVEISSVIPLSLIEEKRIVFEENRKYFKERVPFSMKADREVDRYEDIIFEPDGNTIKLFMKAFFKGNNGENIAFF
jgi:CRISPR-associated protein Cas5h